jgi:lysophospholipase L1-like esterase
MRHKLLGVFLLLAGSLPLWSQTHTNRWESEIAAFETADKTNPPPSGGIVFIGSSSIRLWKSLAQDFPGHPVINRGFGGSCISDSTQFAERIVFPYRPRLIVMYAGGNDINGGKSARQVFIDFKAFVAKVRTRLPEARIAYISIAPNPARWAQVEKVRTANNLIAGFAAQDDKLQFIDVFPHMLGTDGQPKPDIFQADQLHLNRKGYELWKGIVGPFLNGVPESAKPK